MPEIIKSGGGVAGIEQRHAAVAPFALPTTLSYSYSSNNAANPPAGAVYQNNNQDRLTFDPVDQAAHDNTTFFQTLNVNDVVTANGLTWTITSVTQQGANFVIGINPPEQALPFGVTNFVFAAAPTGTLPTFPAFTPIVPPPVFGVGGGPPPTFPPPTPPPIGHVPVGVLVGPAIAPAAVPPSVAGFPLIQFKTGSATSPTAASLFPQFTTTFPNPTIVVGGNNFAAANAGHIPPWTQAPPAQTASTLCIVLDGWGPGVPPGAPTSPGSDGRFPRMVAFEGMMTQAPEAAPEPVENEAEHEPPPEPEPRRPPRRRR